jgi:hypothetical protein
MCLHEKRKAKAVEKGDGSRSTWPVGLHLLSYFLGQVGGAPLWPYKYSLLWWKSEHTHHTLEIPLAKLSFLV